jgi:diguanylate cyclase (GGDEF)-like protein
MLSTLRGARRAADDSRTTRMTFDTATEEAIDPTSQSIEQMLGVPGDESYQRTARLVAASLRAPVAIVCMVDGDRRVVRGCVGVQGRARAWRSAPGSYALAMDALQRGEILDLTDVTAGFEDRSGLYAMLPPASHSVLAAPVLDRDSESIGVICVADPSRDRRWSAEDRGLLHDLATAFGTELALRRELVIRRDTQDALVHVTLHDALTGLPNRAYFLERLRDAFAQAQQDPTLQFAVLFLDLDQFKVVNDSIGHHGGDALLVAVAERLAAAVRPEDTVARLGGDEFAVLLESLSHDDDATMIASRIQTRLATPVDIGGYEVYTSASIGVVLSSSSFLDTERPEHLLRSADMAMYRAKAAGRATYAMFDRSMHRDALARLQLETDLRRALGNGEFQLVYQPIIRCATGRITGVEALLRWHHPERGVVAPADFISVAEDTGLIVAIGAWVLTEACTAVRQWDAHPSASPLTLAVNLSVKQVAQAELAARIADVLADSGLAPARLQLEVTESVIIEHAEAALGVLESLKALGVELHMDDFGTGYSSLSYLHQLPLDGLKIDRAFVTGMESDDRSRQLVATVVQLAHSVGLVTVAEGVTTASQLAELRRLGCDYGQGFLFAAPLDACAMTQLLAADRTW